MDRLRGPCGREEAREASDATRLHAQVEPPAPVDRVRVDADDRARADARLDDGVDTQIAPTQPLRVQDSQTGAGFQLVRTGELEHRVRPVGEVATGFDNGPEPKAVVLERVLLTTDWRLIDPRFHAIGTTNNTLVRSQMQDSALEEGQHDVDNTLATEQFTASGRRRFDHVSHGTDRRIFIDKGTRVTRHAGNFLAIAQDLL